MISRLIAMLCFVTLAYVVIATALFYNAPDEPLYIPSGCVECHVSCGGL